MHNAQSLKVKHVSGLAVILSLVLYCHVKEYGHSLCHSDFLFPLE